MLEQFLMDFGLQEGIFTFLFIYLFHSERKNTLEREAAAKEREEKLYDFLSEMRIEFTKLVDNYESIAQDVSDIRDRLDK